MYLNLYIVILCKKYATLHKVNHQISLLEGLANKANHNFTMAVAFFYVFFYFCGLLIIDEL